MRPRIARKVPVCSSSNYKQSLANYRNHVRSWHQTHKEEILRITSEIKIISHAYTMCFGKRIEITVEEAHKIEKSIKVIYE